MSRNVPPLKLDLYNFEDCEYEDSKYVLTSPRSLEACSKLGVRPVDLLYKPLSEFQEELLPEEIPLRTIFNIYDEQEQARQTKLQLCRKERQRLIEDERSSPSRRQFSLERPSSARPASRRQKCIKITRSYSDEDLSSDQLQRERTAWSTSLGHKRITHNELEARARELHAESQRLRKIILERKEGKKTPRRSRRDNSGVRSSVVRSSSVVSHSRNRERAPQRSQSTSRLNLSTNNEGIPYRDQKILDIMAAKREEEMALNKLRRRAELAWDNNRKMENRARNEAENRRRKLLMEENRIYNNKLKSKQRNKKLEEAAEVEDRKQKQKEKNVKWRSSFLRQHLSKQQKMADKRMFDQLRQRSQKKNLQLQDLDNTEYTEAVKRKQQLSLQKAQNKRHTDLEHRNKNLMINNRNERKLHTSSKSILDVDIADELERSRQLNDLRHSRAKDNYSQMLDSQYRAMSLLHQAREDRHAKARESVNKMEEELESWRKQICKERKKSNMYAENIVNRVNSLKSLKAHNHRLSKEIEHQENVKKLEAEKEVLRYNKENDIYLKERKSEMIQREKDFTVQQLRARAKVTEQLRDSIRKKYDTDTFDKKVLKAEIHANLGKHSPMKATKNGSSVELC